MNALLENAGDLPSRPCGAARPWSVEDSYRHCELLTWNHYENFPVASILIPRFMRRHVAAIYAFARTADDFADESKYRGEEASLLDLWEEMLKHCHDGRVEGPVFTALGDTIRRFDLPLELFLDLLDAFRQDVSVKRYRTFQDLLDYCRRSANPVGRLILRMFGYLRQDLFFWSDHICTALQLTNFWQDLAVDWKKERVYIPQEDMVRFGYTPQELGEGKVTDAFCRLMEFEVRRTEGMFCHGEPLLDNVQGRLRFELTAVWFGGRRILEKLRAGGYDAFRHRPRLTWVDKALILARTAKRCWGRP